jgi:boron transporter
MVSLSVHTFDDMHTDNNASDVTISCIEVSFLEDNNNRTNCFDNDDHAVMIPTTQQLPIATTTTTILNNENGISTIDGDNNKKEPFFQFMTGMKNDVMNVLVPSYKSDWTIPCKKQNLSKVISATIFSFLVQLIPALIFAELLNTSTNGMISVAETLLSAGVIGVLYAIMAGQPLVLLGITGPVAILFGTCYQLADTFHSNYWSFFFWIGLWATILHFITAMSGMINFVQYITSFTCTIFEFFIGITFIYDSIRDLVQPLQLRNSNVDLSENKRGTAWASLVIGIIAFTICWTLHFAEHWKCLNQPIRSCLASYNMVISVTIATALSYIPGANQATEVHKGIDRVDVIAPWDWQPSDQSRDWIINPLHDISLNGIFGALFPALMLHLLFFIDHNISSILTQDPKFNLKKIPTYHWDFFCLGVTIIPCAILGLPPGSGLIPQAPLHTKALATFVRIEEDGVVWEVVTHVEEQRFSALGQALLMFIALASFKVIACIPKSVLFGVLLYLGFGALYYNSIWNHFTYMWMSEQNRPKVPTVVHVKWQTVKIYTCIEIMCALLIFGVAQFATFGTLYIHGRN